MPSEEDEVAVSLRVKALIHAADEAGSNHGEEAAAANGFRSLLTGPEEECAGEEDDAPSSREGELAGTTAWGSWAAWGSWSGAVGCSGVGPCWSA